VRTGPIVNLGLTNPLKNLQYCNQPSTCQNEVCLSNILLEVHVFVDGPDHGNSFGAIVYGQEQWDFRGWFPNPIGGGPPGVITAAQGFPKCHLSSGQVSSTPITKTTKYPTPKLEVAICDDQAKVCLSNLITGAQLKVTRLVGARGGHPSNTDDPSQTRYTPIGDPPWNFNLPSEWPLTDPAGEVSFSFSQQGTGDCALTADTSDPQVVVASTLSPGTSAPAIKLFPETAWYCSNSLEVSDVTTGADLRILRTDGQIVLDWMPVLTSTMILTLPLGLGHSRNASAS
jgi:hypothetical protein